MVHELDDLLVLPVLLLNVMSPPVYDVSESEGNNYGCYC